MAFIDASVVNVALPTIGRDLELGLAGRQWVFLSYSLALASFYLVGGAAGDRFGHRRVFLAAVAAFALASALAGAAPTGVFLIAARALQGVAGAFLTTGSLLELWVVDVTRALRPAARLGQCSRIPPEHGHALERHRCDAGRTVDPLLTMRCARQPVAADGNGFGLALPFPRPFDLPLIATGCNHGAP